jgi:hypothetical protein
MKNFNGRPFFSLFFIARANQKIPNLALGHQSRKGGVMETFMSNLIVVFILQTFTPCLPNGQNRVQKRHSDVDRIETTIKHDINVSITPTFLQGYLEGTGFCQRKHV